MVAEGRALPPLPPSLLGLGIGVGEGWEVVLEYGIGGGRGVPKRHTKGTKHRNHNISPGRFWREKSFVLLFSISILLPYNHLSVTVQFSVYHTSLKILENVSAFEC